MSTPIDFNRSVLQQRTLFGGYQQASPTHNYANISQINHNASVSGPPTQVSIFIIQSSIFYKRKKSFFFIFSCRVSSIH